MTNPATKNRKHQSRPLFDELGIPYTTGVFQRFGIAHWTYAVQRILHRDTSGLTTNVNIIKHPFSHAPEVANFRLKVRLHDSWFELRDLLRPQGIAAQVNYFHVYSIGMAISKLDQVCRKHDLDPATCIPALQSLIQEGIAIDPETHKKIHEQLHNRLMQSLEGMPRLRMYD